MGKQLRVLLIEDSEDDALLIVRALKQGGYTPVWERVQTAAALRKALRNEWDVILADYRMPRFTGLEALRIVQQSAKDIPFIVISGTIGEETAVEAMKAGAHDYIMKENLNRLVPAVEREIREARLRARKKEVEEILDESEEKYRLLFDTAPNGILHVNTRGVIVSCNRAFLRLSGFKKSDIIGKHFTKLPTLPKKNIPEYMKMFSEMLNGKKFKDFEFEWVHKDGSRHWGEGSTSLVKKGKRIIGVQILLSDITKRKEDEHRIQQNERELRQILDATTDGIWTWNFKTDELFFSPKYYTMLGYKPNAFPANFESWMNLIHPDDREKALSVATEYLKTKPDRYENEFRLQTKKGEYRWIHTRARVVERDAKGEALYMVGNHEDITDRKRAELDLKNSETRFKTIIENSQVAICLVTSEGVPIVVNRAFANMMGYSSAELKKMNFSKFTHPEDLKKEFPLYEELIEGKRNSYTIEKRNIRKDGSTIWLRVNIKAVRNENEEITYLVAIGEDISERRTAEEALKESQTRFQQLAENVNEVFHVYDPSQDKFLYVSPAYEQIWERPVQQVMDDPMDFTYPVHPDDRAAFEEAVRREHEDGEYFDLKYRITFEDGRFKWIHSRNFPVFNEAGEPYRTVGIVEDITEHEEAVQALRENREQLKAIFDNSLNAIMVADDSGRYVIANRAAAEMSGLTMDQLLSMNVMDASKNLQPNPVERFEKLIETGQDVGEFEFTRPDGQRKMVQYHAVRVRENFNLSILSDITKRERAKAELKQSQQLLNETQQIAKMGGWGFDVRSGQAKWTDEVYRIHGMNVGQGIETETISLECYHPEDRPKIETAFCKAIEEGVSYDLELRFTTVKGESKWVRTIGKPHLENGEVVRVTGYILDITEKKQAEERMRYQANLLANVKDAVMATDRNFNILYWNKTAEKQYGWTSTEVVGKHFLKIIQPRYPNVSRKKVMRKIYEDGAWTGELLHNRHDGTYFPVLSTISEVRDSDGRIIGHVAINRDITTRKQAQEALQESEEHYRTLVEQSADAIYVIRGDDYVLVNDAWLNMFGYDRETVLSGNFDYMDVVSARDKTFIRERVRRRDQGKPVDNYYEFRGVTKDKRELELEVRLSDILWDGKPAVQGMYRDITERKRAERELAENEKKYHSLTDNIPGMVYRAGPDWSAEFFSGSERICGHGIEEFNSSRIRWFDIIHPEDKERIVEEGAKLQKKPASIVQEYRIIAKDGTTRWVSDHKNSFFDSEGKFGGIDGVVFDTTERVKAELALKESERLYREAQRVAHIGHWELDPEVGTQVWSEEIFRIFGIDPEKGEPSFTDNETHLHEDDWPLLNKAVTKASTDGTPFDLQYRIVRPNGEIRWMHVIGTTTKDENGKIVKLFGTAQDITDQRQAEDALRSSEARFSTIFKANPAAIAMTRLHDNRLVSVNQAFLEITGYDEDEVLNHTPSDLKLWVEPRHRETIIGMLKKTGTVRDEIKVRRKSGEIRDVLFSAETIELSSERFMVSMAQDITERKQAQERLEGLNHLKEKLLGAGTLAHKMGHLSDAVIDIMDADFARIWLIKPGDRCESDCMHASVKEGPHICRFKDKCLHLVASSGRYTHTDGDVHRRVPFDCYKIGRVAASEEPGFLTNDVTHDSRVHNHAWAKELGLVSFAGYRLQSHDGETIGVLALFSRHTLSPSDEALLQTMATTASEVVIANKAEEALKASEARYRTLFEEDLSGDFVSTPEGNLIDCNQAYLDIYGFDTKDEALRTATVKTYVSPDARKRFLEDLKKHGRLENYEEQMVRRDGEIRTIMSNIIGEKDTNGNICQIRGYIVDVTDRKQAETALRESEEKYRQLYDEAPIGYHEVDRNGIILRVNHAEAEMLGYSVEEIIGRSVFDFIAPEEREAAQSAFKLKLEKKQSVGGFERKYISKNGEIIDMLIEDHLIFDDRGNITGLFSTRQNITKRKNAEEDLMASLREKEVLLREVHHRVKNNLQIIISLLNLQAKKITDEEALHQCSEARRRIYSMALVHDKLYQSEDFASIEFGNYIRTISRELIGGLQTITLEQDLAPVHLGIDIAIPCGLVINELITNAVKHAFPDGRGTIKVSLRAENGECRLNVRDDGIGLPAEIDVATTESLGLQLVSILTEQIKGTLEVGRKGGASFTITFRHTTSSRDVLDGIASGSSIREQGGTEELMNGPTP